MGAYLLSLVESFAVTVGQVHGPGHHAWAGFELLQGRLHVSAAGALCADRGMRGVAGPRWTPPGGSELGARGVGAKGSVGEVTTFCSNSLLPKIFPFSHLSRALGAESVQKLRFDQVQKHTARSVFHTGRPKRFRAAEKGGVEGVASATVRTPLRATGTAGACSGLAVAGWRFPAHSDKPWAPINRSSKNSPLQVAGPSLSLA